MYLTERINALVKYVDVPRVLQHILPRRGVLDIGFRMLHNQCNARY